MNVIDNKISSYLRPRTNTLTSNTGDKKNYHRYNTSNDLSQNNKSRKSGVEDMEHSLHLMNFKLNFDILQNKINRLNSLIPSETNTTATLKSIIPMEKYSTNKNFETVDSSKMNNNNKMNNNFGNMSYKNLSTNASTSYKDLDAKINDTKEKINYYIRKHSRTIAPPRFASELNNTQSNFKTYNNLSNSSLQMFSEMQNRKYGRNFDHRNTLNNLKISGKNLMINTSISNTDLFTESVQQFCITPSERFNTINTINTVEKNTVRHCRNSKIIFPATKEISQTDLKSSVEIRSKSSEKSENLSALIDNILDYREENKDDVNDYGDELISNLRTKNYKTLYDRSKDSSQIANANKSNRNSEHLDYFFTNYVSRNSRDSMRKKLKEDFMQSSNSNLINQLSSPRNDFDSVETPVTNNNRKSRNNTPSIEKMNNLSKNKSKSLLNNLNSLSNNNNAGNNTSRTKKSDNIVLNFNEKKECIMKEEYVQTDFDDINEDNCNDKQNTCEDNNEGKGILGNDNHEHITEEDQNEEDRDASFIINEILRNSKNDNKDDEVGKVEEDEVENEVENEDGEEDEGGNEEKEIEEENDEENEGEVEEENNSEEEKNENSENIEENSQKNTSNLQESITPPQNIEKNEILSPQKSNEKLPKKRVTFTDDPITIAYEEQNIIQDLFLIDEEGVLVKHKKRDFQQYFKLLKNKRKPKSILLRRHKKNTSEVERALALEKLNNLINECDNCESEEEDDNRNSQSCSPMKRKSPSKIMERNKQMVQDIEIARKKGNVLSVIRKRRAPTPRKPKKVECCHKFTKNPLKFFSQPPCEIVLKSLDLPAENNFSKSDLNFKLNVLPFKNESTEEVQRNCKSEENSPNKQREQRGRLKAIIRNINIEQSMQRMESESKKMLESSSHLSSIAEINSPQKSTTSVNSNFRKQSL